MSNCVRIYPLSHAMAAHFTSVSVRLCVPPSRGGIAGPVLATWTLLSLLSWVDMVGANFLHKILTAVHSHLGKNPTQPNQIKQQQNKKPNPTGSQGDASQVRTLAMQDDLSSIPGSSLFNVQLLWHASAILVLLQ